MDKTNVKPSIPTIVYHVPSTTFFYVPGTERIYQTYHAANKTFGLDVDSRRGRYLVGLVTTKGSLSFVNKK